MERLKKWQDRREKQSHSMLVQDRKRLNLANRFMKDQGDSIAKRRAQNAEAELERHKRMVEKVKLEKLFVQE
eukprot:CAMPEP_0170453268 /NCGR_PEP_ID=MMETSP0123-20130129/1900_1 /TAXON_ID=182087 /ORGANISM="Favella ehrenbergii, Strain Fehren 1" /LENGTH=71 /DNA_ID=CAMNT_0010715571 /DNA_START=758 /DNA_END=973 /DNA_ORIENTATION=-